MDFAVYAVMGIGLVFAFFNGFHDAGVITGNAVFTRALDRRWALALSTFFNFLGALAGQGIVMVVTSNLLELPHSPDAILLVIAAALLAGIAVSIGTYLMGLPVASTHTLFGGLIGAGLIMGFGLSDGPGVIFSTNLWPLVIGPLTAFLGSAMLMALTTRLFQESAPKPLYRTSRQIDSIMVAALSLAHGSQDAQKIGAVLAIAWATRVDGSETLVPEQRSWILIVLVAVALAAGTFSSGWRVARTLSKRLVTLNPLRAAVADTTSMALMSLASFVLRIPLSISFVMVGSSLGTQVEAGRNSVHYPTVARVLVVFALGMPVTALLAAIMTQALLSMLPV